MNITAFQRQNFLSKVTGRRTRHEALRLYNYNNVLASSLANLRGYEHVEQENPKVRLSTKLFETLQFHGKPASPKAMAAFYVLLAAVDWKSFKDNPDYFERTFSVRTNVLRRYLGIDCDQVHYLLEELNTCMVSWKFGNYKGFPSREVRPLMSCKIEDRHIVFAPGQLFLYACSISRHWMTVELHAARKFRSTMSHLVYAQLVQAASQEHTNSLFIPTDKLVEYGYNGRTQPAAVRERFVGQILNDFELSNVRSFKITDVEVIKEGVTFHVSGYEKDLHEHRNFFLKTADKKILDDVAYEQQPTPTLLSKSIQFTKKSAMEILSGWKKYVTSSDASEEIKTLGVTSVFSAFVRNLDSFVTTKSVPKRFVHLLESVACGELFAVKHFLRPEKNKEILMFQELLGSYVKSDDFNSKFEAIINNQSHEVLNDLAMSIASAYDTGDQDIAKSVWDYMTSLKPPTVIV